MKVRLLLCLFLLAGLFACKKDEEAAPDRRALLTARAWKLNEALANGVPVTDPQLLNAIGVLSQSAVRFNNDGTLTATDNNTGAVTTGTWQFGSTQDQLLTSIGGTNFTFTIKALDGESEVGAYHPLFRIVAGGAPAYRQRRTAHDSRLSYPAPYPFPRRPAAVPAGRRGLRHASILQVDCWMRTKSTHLINTTFGSPDA